MELQNDRYKIVREIGHGGMASVYEAIDRKLDRPVAIKVLHEHLRKSEQARRRFTREAKSVARIRSDSVVRVYDQSVDDAFIVMELIEGLTLREYVKKHGKVFPEIAIAITLCVADALEVAHNIGIIHRDVKPDNILIHDSRMVKLTDFGIALVADANTMTATGQVLGSPGHMAPEQIDAGRVDERSDIFSLTTVLYFLIHGEPPFKGQNTHQLLHRVVTGTFPSLDRVETIAGKKLSDFVSRALSVEPDDRPQDIKEYRAKLLGILQETIESRPAEVVERFLEEPEEFSRQIEEKVAASQLRLAQEAATQDKRLEAFAYLNRALAINPNDQDARSLLDRLERGSKRGTLIKRFAIVGVVLAVLLSLYFVFEMAPDEGSTELLVRTPPARVDDGEKAVLVSDAGSLDSRLEMETSEQGKPERVVEKPDRPTSPAAEPRMRLVVFRPTPETVRITIDDMPSAEYGPSFNRARLKVGEHRFRFESTDGCCRPRLVTQSVPPGRSSFLVEVSLPFRDAILRAKSSIPGRIEVIRNGKVSSSGRANEIVLVPMSSLEEELLIRFQPDNPDLSPKSKSIALAAGKSKNISL